MALTQQTRAYETLIRHNADGTVSAHYQTITEITDGTNVLAAAVDNPMPIDQAVTANPSLATVLGQATTDALAQVATLQAQLTAANAQIATLQAQLNQNAAVNAPGV